MKYLKSQLVFLVICLAAIGLVLIGCSNPGDVEKKAEAQATDQSLKSALDNSSKPQAQKATNEDGKSPKMVFAEVTHDFGKQVAGPELTHSFTFKNEGDGTLMIEKVKAG